MVFSIPTSWIRTKSRLASDVGECSVNFIVHDWHLHTNDSICPGRHLAKDTAFLTMAVILHVFDVLPAVDEYGKELDPTPQMTTGVQSYVLNHSFLQTSVLKLLVPATLTR